VINRHMSSSLKSILLLLALVCLAKCHVETTCNHHEHQEQSPPQLLDIEEDFGSIESGRVLVSSDYPKLKFYANYESLEKTASASYASYIRDELAPAVISYFESTLSVKFPVAGGKLIVSSSVKTLCDVNTPTDLKNGVDAQYAILFTSRSESGSNLASSKNCNLASGSKRPLIGQTAFNRNMLKEAKGDAIMHEKNTYLLLHEIMHTLGFSKSLYKYFVDANGKTLSGHIKSVKIAGETRTAIDIAPLTEKLRNFHGCSSIPGAIMADGDDSHWDKKLYLYETMQSGAINGKRISEFSLGFLEASGWYAVDYDYAEPYFYGQGQGCDFINGVCSSSKAAFEEFCVGSSKGCNFMGNSGGSCSSGSSMGKCKYVIPSESSHCEDPESIDNARLPSVESFGRDSGSRCFTGTLNSRSSTSTSAFCFKFACDGEGMNTKLEVILGSKRAVCNKEGPLSVDGYYGSINCPDPLTFCNTVGKKYCPRQCMGRGECVDNKCQCNSGFTGIDCAMLA